MRDESDERFSAAATVLIAEEDDDVRQSLADALTHDGYRVVVVEDGLELFDYLALVEASRGRLPVPSVVVSDVELAGCPGATACRRIHARYPSLPCVLLAPGHDRLCWSEASAAGADDVMAKPVDVDELRATVFLLAS